MDWTLAIDRNREALKRILASLVAMAGLSGAAPFTSPLWGGRQSSDCRVGVPGAALPPPDASRRPPPKGEVKPELTLPRRLHRAVTKLLRPAESAARRLIVMAARGIKVPPPPPPRPKKAEPKTNEAVLRSLGIAVTMSPADFARAATAARRPATVPVKRPRTFSLPLFDPLRMPRRWRPIQRSFPRILFPGNPDFVPAPARRLPTLDDPVSGGRLALRLRALASVLDDLPRHALRLARLRASRKATTERDRNAGILGPGRWRHHRDWPLKPGHPPGSRKKPTHEVHEVLKDVHYFAFYALEHPDTS